MNLREAKRKKGAKVKPRPPLPINTKESLEWTMYTAHLTDLGSCISDPNEINAIHSMGFFGKGTLSRSFPSFGKARYGAPPIVRNRQWIRRQEWLKQLNELSEQSDYNPQLEVEECQESFHPNNDYENVDNEKENNGIFPEDELEEDTSDIIELDKNATKLDKSKDVLIEKEVEIEQVNLDSTEEDDVLIISNKDNTKEAYENFGTDSQKLVTSKEIEQAYDLNNSDLMEDKAHSLNKDTSVQNKLLILPDSDSETENYLKEIKPRVEPQSFPVQETLHLTFEETFFLLFGLGCLNLINFDGTLLDIASAWHYFCGVDKNFIQKYVVYHYFRSKGWVVKPGIKYGGDFLLYKEGPPFYHASYIVIIDVVDADTLIRNPNKSMRTLTWNNLLGLERLSETASKEILFAQVLWPSSVSEESIPPTPDILSEFSIKELLWRRLNPKSNKNVIDLEEEEEEDSC